MKRCVLLCAVGLAITLSSVSAQVTFLNGATGVSNPYASTIGTLVTFANLPVTVNIGSGAAHRSGGPGSASYLPTGAALNPAQGFTVQWWIQPLAGGTSLQYCWGDPTSVSPLGTGQLRCFANGSYSLNGNLVVRGLPVDAATITAPFTTVLAPGPLLPGGLGGGTNANGWVHLAFRYDPLTQNATWHVNGTLVNTIPQSGYNWSGTNVHFMGYGGTVSPALAGNYDDLRIYNFARTDADIAADYQVAALGLGPSGAPNLPNGAYFDFDGAFDPHLMFMGTNLEPTDAGTRIITNGTVVDWGSNCPNQPGNLASHVLNIHGPSFGGAALRGYDVAYRLSPPLPTNYATPGVPGLRLGHGYSVPANPAALAWVDSHGLGSIPGLVFLGLPGQYSYGVSPNVQFLIPPIFMDGDRIDFQSLAFDPVYPLSLGTSNKTTMVYRNCAAVNPGPHCHIEARGPGSIQVTGFHQIWNTGTVDITQVVIDISTCVANGGSVTGWAPFCTLNTGGNLGLGTSYRYNTDIFTGLLNPPSGFTGLGLFQATCPQGTATSNHYTGLQFNFNNFTACTDELLFDCEVVPYNSFGSAMRGATVSVTFANSVILTGLLAPDPLDPLGVVLDL